MTEKIISFIREIGLSVKEGKLNNDTFLPGITVENGGLVIDHEKLKYPGDLLHEAGHLAVLEPRKRNRISGNLEDDKDLEVSAEMMAIAWSYAAALHIGIEPAIVFHPDGYRGGSKSILDNFSKQQYFGLPMLQWIGLTYEPKKAKELGKEAFPKMIKWLRE